MRNFVKFGMTQNGLKIRWHRGQTPALANKRPRLGVPRFPLVSAVSPLDREGKIGFKALRGVSVAVPPYSSASMKPSRFGILILARASASNGCSSAIMPFRYSR